MEMSDFVQARGPSLMRLSYLLVGDAHEAEDVVQTVLARLAPRWESVLRVDNLDAYVRTAISNEAASWWRRHRRRREIIGHPFAPESATIDADLTQRFAIMQLLRDLPLKQRSVIVLRYYEDCTEAEIASILGCGVGTVKSQAAKARLALRAGWDALNVETTRAEEPREGIR